MAMTSAMEEVLYNKRDFNFDHKVHRHPDYVTDRHFYYHLCLDDHGYLNSMRDDKGNTIRSPRLLRDICINRIVSEPSILLKSSNWQLLPGNVFPALLSEAILVREVQAIVWLVSVWPMLYLRVSDIVPLEDDIVDAYLTIPIDRGICLADCFVFGLLSLKPESHLRYIDFTSFDKDRKLCKELCRLPILWMKPEVRTVDQIHDYMSESLDVSKDKTERFLNRISVVYSDVDIDIKHGNKISSITIIVDLKVSIDDVPLGLSLRRHSPFKFSCARLWMKPVSEVNLSPCDLGKVLDTNRITYFEYEDSMLPSNENSLASFIEGLVVLRNLFGLSLPNTLDVNLNQGMVTQINGALKTLKFLRRLDVSYSNLQGHLEELLDGLAQRICYLNLKDCRLVEDDLFFLLRWPALAGLRELNLSHNNLQYLDQVVIGLLEQMPLITCLSLSYCMLSVHSLVLLAHECKESANLKVLCMQGYTPPAHDEAFELLHICAQIVTLQKFIMYPEDYAFPGANEDERQVNRMVQLSLSYRYLAIRGRRNIELE